ncbi:ATP-binding protein [Clostridium sp. HMP27]|uniref:ATP-binding protein n=1 Tax=Clostridium sp. HMP27 TaxID=1487921 RepID=UPI00052B85C9|nr:ATP-binding protein [Clostridium sp. HMP27]KGK86557.1 hypothetical protein DP68_13180 [Clostridium sp. HMP27]
MKDNKVNAAPTKEFVIQTITKDIRIQAAIFDLIDNSINAAEALTNPKRLQGYKVELKINGAEFQISDNCGGISRDKIFGDALKIGSSIEYTGGHGIGLKRAFLKIGKKIEILSNRPDYSCRIKIDVDKWGKNDNWDINIKEEAFEDNLSQGLTIIISNLYEEICKNFSKHKFINELINEIELRYRYKLQAGFSIEVNKNILKPAVINGIKIAESSYESFDGITTKIMLHNNVTSKENGWDIIVNGRVVLEHDKTEKTLWRKNLIKKGHSYENFVGEVFIEGENIKKLPIWSTKDGIDINSETYEKVLNRMYNLVDKYRAPFIKQEVSIQYEKPSDQVQVLKEYFDVTTAKDVGKRSFEYTYNNVGSNKDN